MNKQSRSWGVCVCVRAFVRNFSGNSRPLVKDTPKVSALLGEAESKAGYRVRLEVLSSGWRGAHQPRKDEQIPTAGGRAKQELTQEVPLKFLSSEFNIQSLKDFLTRNRWEEKRGGRKSRTGQHVPHQDGCTPWLLPSPV